MPTEISGSTGVNKIQDGTVVEADLSRATGEVLQVQSVCPNTGLVQLSTASWTEVSSSLRVSITPKYANSVFIVEALFNFGGHYDSNITHFQIRDITNGTVPNIDTASNRQGVHGTARQHDNDANDCDQMYVSVRTSYSNTNAITFGLYAKNESGSSTKSFFAHESDSSNLAYVKPILKVTEYKS
tara:strand:+ start:98 stop:652 length:555 start_codon:yes stop_codon:yes gene_type:complete